MRLAPSEYKIKIGNKSKSSLVKALLELDDINDLIAKYAYEDAANRMEAEDKKLEAAAYVGVNYDEINENRTVLSQTMRG